MASAAFVTLGCKVNQFETEVMEGLFKEAGYEIVEHSQPADVYVINTCSVTSLGDKKSRQLIRRVQRQNPEAVIAVTGCYAQIAPEQIKAIEGVRVVLGTANRRRIVEYVEQAILQNGKIIDGVTDIMQVREFGKAKYADAEDWRKVPREKWLDALLRHVLHIWDNPLALDDESGLPALWHVITNAAFLCAAYKKDMQASVVQKAVNDDLAEWRDEPELCCTEIYCDSFTQTCKNHCLKHLDVRDFKEVQQCEDASGRGND